MVKLPTLAVTADDNVANTGSHGWWQCSSVFPWFRLISITIHPVKTIGQGKTFRRIALSWNLKKYDPELCKIFFQLVMNIVNRRHQNCKKHDRKINAIIKFGPQKCRQQTVTGFENSFVYCWSSNIFTGPTLFTSDRLRKGIGYVHIQCIYWCWLCLKQNYSHLTPDGKKTLENI